MTTGQRECNLHRWPARHRRGSGTGRMHTGWDCRDL